MESPDQEAIFNTDNLLRNPPKGAWVKKDIGKEIIGVSTNSKSAIFLFFFSIAFSGVTFLVIYQFLFLRLIIGLVFMSIFAVVSIILWIHVFYLAFGKIELVMDKNGQDYIFTGIGKVGKKLILNWSSIKSIYEQTIKDSENSSRRKIFIDAEKLLTISLDGINNEKSTFLLQVLKYQKEIKDRFQLY